MTSVIRDMISQEILAILLAVSVHLVGISRCTAFCGDSLVGVV